MTDRQPYTIAFSPGRYTLMAGSKQAIQECRFGPCTDEQRAYLTLCVGLGDLLVRISSSNANPFEYAVDVRPEDEGIYDLLMGSAVYGDPMLQKLHRRALGLLKRFGQYRIVFDMEAERV